MTTFDEKRTRWARMMMAEGSRRMTFLPVDPALSFGSRIALIPRFSEWMGLEDRDL